MKSAQLVYDLVPALNKTKSGTPIVILHGLLGTRLNFSSLARRKEICSDSDVYLLDMRNHGWSPHKEEHSAEIMSLDVQEFLKQKGISQAIMVGFSMGGKAAMHLAFNYPQLCRGLLLLDCGPFNYPSFQLPDVNYQHVLDHLASFDLKALKSREAIRAQIMKEITDSRPMVDFLMSNLVWSSPIASNTTTPPSWRCNLPVLQRDYHRHSSWVPSPGQTYTGPVKLVRGRESNYLPEGRLGDMPQYFPELNLDTDVVAVEGGHWVHLSDPRTVLRTAQDLISKCSSRHTT